MYVRTDKKIVPEKQVRQMGFEVVRCDEEKDLEEFLAFVFDLGFFEFS